MTALLKNPVERTRFIKFAIVGALGALIDFGVMNLLVWLAKATLVVAGSVSFVCAVLSNFTWNRLWTYPESRTKHVFGQLIQFTIVNAIGLVIRVPILKIGEPALDHLLETSSLDLLAHSHTFISHNATLAIAIGIVMLWNYFVNRYWTYNDID
ncbi:MAG: GtrA family protein [Anaerolineales bacterium]|nr:GtrA family protein [Anaerolineales bacterium]MDW8278227.1 GtrA family protein [Anaerolineales bacterium]